LFAWAMRRPAEEIIANYYLRRLVRIGDQVTLGNVEGTADRFAALGLVLNRPSETTVGEAVSELEPLLDVDDPLYIGGPVQPSALIVLARDAELRRRMGAYGREKAGRFGWDVVAAQILEVYEEAREARAASAVGEAQVAQIEEINVHDAV